MKMNRTIIISTTELQKSNTNVSVILFYYIRSCRLSDAANAFHGAACITETSILILDVRFEEFLFSEIVW